MNHGLSKSRLMDGRQCPRKLWLRTHRPDLAEVSADTETRFRIGFEVGAQARALYPTGRLIETSDLSEALRETRAALAEAPATPLFEAAFVRDGVAVRVDLLLPEADGYRLVEVKASTSVKPQHREDLAIQAWVVQATLPLSGARLAHVDKEFVYPGGGDYRGLFHPVDLVENLAPLLAEVPRWVAEARATLEGDEPPVAPGDQCQDPYDCPFQGHCAGPEVLPSTAYPVTSLPRLGGSRLRGLAEQGITDIRQISPDYPLSDRQRRVADCVRAGRAYLDPEATRIVRALGWPRFFMDFETTQCAVPPWAGTRPYQQLPVQWSCPMYWMPGIGSAQYFLYNGEAEPQRAFAETLIQAVCQPCDHPFTYLSPISQALTPITQDCARRYWHREAHLGPILVYNASFERRILGELAEALPDLAPALDGIAARLVDLLPLLRDHYYHPEQQGSWSLKAVAPTLTRVRYDLLEIGDGGAASDAWRELLHPLTSEDRRAELRTALSDYRGLDTRALIQILETLQRGDACPSSA